MSSNLLRLFSFQPLLQHSACLFPLGIEAIGVDVKRGAHLAVPEQPRHGCNVRTVGNQQAGIGVAQRMHIEILGQAVLADDVLKLRRERAGTHGKLAVQPAEKVD